MHYVQTISMFLAVVVFFLFSCVLFSMQLAAWNFAEVGLRYKMLVSVQRTSAWLSKYASTAKKIGNRLREWNQKAREKHKISSKRT